MKKNYKFLLAAFAIVAAASCAKEIAPVEKESAYDGNLVPIVISATGEEATKTTLGEGRSVIWQEGDKVSILDNKGAWGALTVSSGAGTNKATLSGSIAEGATELWSVYPESAVGSFQSGVASVVIPSEQTVSAAAPADPAALISAAHTTDLTTLQYKNMTSLVQFTVSADDAITAVLITSNGDQALSGTYYVNAEELTITLDTGGVYANGVIVKPADGTFATGTYYAVVAPVELAQGITVTFQKENGAAVSFKKSETAATLVRNSGINLGKIAPSTWLPVQIRNGEELKAFSENLASYPESAQVVIANDIDMSGIKLNVTEGTFLGSLDGQNYSINNWESTCPIMPVSKGEIKNIVIGASCTLTPAPGNYGPIAGRAYGKVSNCVNNAPLSLTDTDCTQYLIGGVVGRLEGQMENCSNTADMTINLSNSTVTAVADAKPNYIGGVVAMSATPQETDRLVNCKNSGNITLNVTGAPLEEGCTISHAYVAGVVGSTGINRPASDDITSGYAKNYGNFIGCENSGNIVYNHPDGGAGAYGVVGGVAGYVEGHLKECKNSGNVKYANSMTVSNSKPAVGGVAAIIAHSAVDCTNSGEVALEGIFANGSSGTATASLGMIYGTVGGCFGTVGIDATAITNCDNSGTVKVNSDMPTTNKSAVAFGGVIGGQAGANCNVKDCDNTGAMTITNGTHTAHIAGVVAFNKGNTYDCTNSAEITVNHETTDITDPTTAIINLGGVVGYNYLEVATCSNTGNITLNASGNTRLGGVVGMYGQGTFDCKGCVNSGAITFNKTADVKKLSYVAGVIGCMNIQYGVKDCSNSGAVTVTSTKSSTASYCGGVTSYTVGTSIENCSNTGDITVDGGAATTQYFVGGVLGCNKKGASKCLMDNCSNTGKVTLTNHKCTGSFVYVGGVHGGYATSAPSLTKCTNSGEVYADAGSMFRVGGVTGAANSLLTDCSNTAKVTMLNGATGSQAGPLAGYFSGTKVDGSFCGGSITATGNVASAVGACFGALGETTRVWQNLTIDATVTTDQDAGYFVGIVPDSAKALYTLGADGAPIVFKKSTAINGTTIPASPTVADLTPSGTLTIANVVVE